MFAYVISQIQCWIFRYGGGLLYAYLLVLAFSALLQSALQLGEKIFNHMQLYLKKCVRLCDLLTFYSNLTFRTETTSSVLYQQPQRFCKACTNTFSNLLQVSLHRNELKIDSQKSSYPDSRAKFKSIFVLLKVGDAVRTCQEALLPLYCCI